MKTIFFGLFVLAASSYADHNDGGEPYRIECESSDYQYRACTTPTEIQVVKLESQASIYTCTYGETWGFTDRYVWVDRGCHGIFVVTPKPKIVVRQISCSSSHYKYTTCAAGGPVYDVRLLHQESKIGRAHV